MIIAKNYLQQLIKEELRHLLELNKILVLEGDAAQLREPADVLKTFAKKLASRGYDVSNAKELGSGFNGTAYSFGDGTKVIKISIDEHEARAANHLKGKKLKHVIPIYDVFKFKTNGTDNWFGIIEGKATNISQSEKLNFDMYIKLILSNLNLNTMSALDNSPWMMPWPQTKQRVLENTKPDPEEYKTAQEGFAFLQDLGFDKLLAELKANNVEYFDVHAGNFMNYRGRFVLVDLGGNSQSPGAIPNMLEKRKI